MSTRLLEICRESKYIHRKELCVELVIYQAVSLVIAGTSPSKPAPEVVLLNEKPKVSA